MEAWIEITLLATAVGIIGLMVGAYGARQARRFRTRWPAISDEEFLAKCSPGTNPQRALKVRRIIAEQLGVPYDHIHPEQKFVDDLDC